ncbi:hypothetical protein DXG01_004751 [Tephrocybe rancida]|nr:hypothetical protein DXG01_004751 [Tephrocybe rancida]
MVVEEASVLPIAPSTSQTPISKKCLRSDKTLSLTLPQPSGSKSKHPHQIALLCNQFLDLEAQEDYQDEEDILVDKDDDLDNFLNDKVFWDDEDTAGPRQISHRLAANTVSDLEWEGLLQHAKQRASEDDDSEEDDSDQRRLERMGLARLWRVAVKYTEEALQEGYEETAPIVLFNKILKAGWTSVTSVFRRVSCLGWIFIETDSISEAQKVAVFASTRHPFTSVTLPMLSTTIIEEKTTRARIVQVLGRVYLLFLASSPSWIGKFVWIDRSEGGSAPHGGWKDIRFEHGFLFLDSHDVEPAVTTHKELEFFRHVDVIPTQALAAAQDEITKSLLWEGDLVMVHWGEMWGGVRRITQVDVDVNEALVYFESSNIETFVHTSDLHKSIKLGDRVSVVGGNNNGRVGWVVARNAAGELALWDDAMQTYFNVDLSQASLIDLDRVPEEAVEAMEKLREDNRKKYMNRCVRIVGKHPFKDYEGIAAPLVQLQQEPREAMEIPLSNMPLSLSTPIPVGSSAHMSPAWNPSSCTLNPSNLFSCNPYIQSPYLNRKLKVKARVHNTKPVLDDPGFRNGDFKGLRGLWKAEDHDRPGIAKITFMVPRVRTEIIPERYVTPLRLTQQKELVIIDNAHTHTVYYVLKVVGDTCHVHDHEDCNKKNFHELPTWTLAASYSRNDKYIQL